MTIQRTRILAVEDDLATRAALFGLLGDESLEVFRACTAEAALGELRTRAFDLLLADDDGPPHGTGLWVATRAHEEALVRRVVLLTQTPFAHGNGWLTVVRKPLTAPQLVKAVFELLEDTGAVPHPIAMISEAEGQQPSASWPVARAFQVKWNVNGVTSVP